MRVGQLIITKMILIVSSSTDNSTNDVIDWLISWKAKFIRINETDNLAFINYDSTKGSLVIRVNGKEVDLTDITGYWYRRGTAQDNVHSNEIAVNSELEIDMQLYRERELRKVNQLLQLYLFKLPHIGSQSHNHTNKIHNLELARRAGMSVPSTIIATTKKQVQAFLKEHPEGIISKAIYQGFHHSGSEGDLMAYTAIADQSHVEALPLTFFPTLYQEQVEKVIELRVFFLLGHCDSQAIFSQEDDQTSVDFRDYNYEKPNRVVPFDLPEKIVSQIVTVMKSLKMESGSIDMIVTPHGKYIWLEVNPVGQFRQVSKPCNLYLEKKVAHALLTMNNEGGN
jgi:ATP-GRASP peptide maturase of grasp-with-spasm system